MASTRPVGDAAQVEDGPVRGPLVSVLNAVALLDTFSVAEPRLSVTEIARRLDLHKSTVSRLLGTLESVGLVERDGGKGHFGLGVGILGLAGPLLAHLDVRKIAYPEIEALVHATGETCALALWSGHESIVVEQIPSPRQVKHTTPLGARFSKVASASVRVFLAELPESRVRTLLREGLVTADGRDAEAVLEELAAVHRDGLAVNDGDTDPEELSISSPIRDHRGLVTGAVLLSAPRARVTPFLRDDYGERVRRSAASVSSRLGGLVSGG
ncbi:transcriptional regulator, IclR family [Pseudonocardia ammonioxydans]|uniref:Glycerol operon regulatory protein n=1 Tax=Pseudonocardia ammonioxydans TaxID=260086 RepID=A0A1I4YEB1_PSUAM|nr:IclR family transcriptional regulator [Pseudonocardia ammonioxydans]SFN35940.1 transcriptional regulator, IclR family [Pseudonocardia ammonioxydans]